MSRLTTRRRLMLSMGWLALTRLFADEPKPSAPAYNNMSDEQEISLGRETALEIEKERKLKFVEEPAIRSYVNQVLNQIVQTCRRPNLPYSIKIVDTASVNAFALPGGVVYLNRGLMEWAHSESEMAGALAHEVGHVVGRHGANAICRANSADSLLSEASHVLFGDDTPARVLKELGGPLAVLALLKYSREQELEADLLGFYNLQRAGWTPNGMLSLFKRFDDSSNAVDSLLAVTSDHPLPSEREEQIRSEMKRFPPAPSLKDDSADFQSMQVEMKKLPPPPKASRSSQS